MPSKDSIIYNKAASLVQLVSALIAGLLSCQSPKTNTIGSIERIDPALDDILRKDARVEIIAEGFDWSEGPLWVEKEKMLLFSDIPPNTIYKWTPGKGKEVYLKPSGYTGQKPRGGEIGSNGLLLNLQGELVLCQHGDRRIAKMNAPVSAPAPDFITIADNYNGLAFDSPNDAVMRSNGDIYFTDPPYGLENYINDSTKAAPYQGVYRVTADGKVTLLVDSISRPNGIGFFPGEQTLLVSNSDSKNAVWYAFDLAPNDSLINGRIWYDATEAAITDKGGPDGFKVDKEGNVYATGPGGIWIFDRNAKLLGKIRIPVQTSNCALADDDKTLYITADMYVLKVSMR